jgi:DNA-binding transcriptional LysR family regulator
MDAHLLRTFVTVARLGSFSAAAVELQYTQAAVSQQVAALESDLKVTLLRRRPVGPTEAGTRLLEHAIPILLRMDAARADVTRMTSPPAARLALALTPLAAATSPALTRLAELRARMPRLDVAVRVTGRDQVVEAAARGEADLGLTDGLVAPSDPLPLPVPLSAVGVAESLVTVIVPADHPLARSPAGVGLADLADARWIDAPRVAPSLDELRRTAGTDGYRPGFRYDGADTLTLLRLAAEGHGLTLLPELPGGAMAPSPGLAAIPVTTRLVHRVELIHGTLPADSPAATFAAMLTA